MIDYVRKILTGQVEASLCMLDDCIKKCPEAHWDGRIAKYSFWHVAYHTLCFADLYTWPNLESFRPRPESHPRGRDEFLGRFPIPSWRFGKDELGAYAGVCRQQAAETLAAETAETLECGSGFPWLPFSRGELHIYNARHIQHHTGQLSAYLRRVDGALADSTAVKWVDTGWK